MLQLAAWVWLAVIWLLYFAGWLRLLGLALTASAAWYALAVGSGGEAVLFLQPQQIAVAATLHGGVVLPWLQLLHWQTDGGRQIYQAVWPDSADAEGLRCLRVWARWGQARKKRSKAVDMQDFR